ncbi:6-phosphofructokinase [Acetivibrio clariflavus]|uniref:ATP-dependent 6-phosphofructokinase n=1 Tax=Acetivibrio clariflavus (strain DSM 19732 / NBRC 101661 / EBR45) TaxID=720554 RepID=G8LY91_ACECE|nr:6-phosphofructokinase [Acetivibrio clariflavus]AEV67822.1 6-phosphofructokinase [Acetivibrio clariflavus DSM 19732]HOQ01654.1 6-phosphofructokinase [Acetivibrio clariflavus]HPU42408.1 6-phosphofructokinase [Acetivibrio clariflavus]
MIKRIGVLTGGGDCPGLNAVLRAVVKTAIVKYGYEVIGFKDGFKGLVDNKFVKLELDDVSGLLDRGGTILGTSNKHNPFKFPVNVDGNTEYKDMSKRVLENLDMFGIDCMVFIGGDGTLTTARDLMKMGIKGIGVPKTIDNDLSGTDTTFGFMTAVYTATEAIDKLHSTAESHHRVMILEVMGRYAGWIALEAGISGGADVILIPEIPYDINKVAQKVMERKNRGKSFSIIVVAEGAKDVEGDMVVNKVVEDSPDPIRLGGVGNKIAAEIERITGIESRVTVLGHLQRGGTPVPYDRILSTRYGVHAVELINQGKFGMMVSLKGNRITEVPIEEAVGTLKTVDPDGELVKIAKSLGVGFGD